MVQRNCLMVNKINLKEPGHYALWKAWGWPFRSGFFWSMRDTCHSLQKAPCCYHKESPAGCTGPHFPGNSFFLHWGKQGFLRFSFRVRITMVIRWLSVGPLVQCHLQLHWRHCGRECAVVTCCFAQPWLWCLPVSNWDVPCPGLSFLICKIGCWERVPLKAVRLSEITHVEHLGYVLSLVVVLLDKVC